MPDLVIIVPSRERPHAARELADAFLQTCTADTHLVFAVDDNDPTREQYLNLVVEPTGLPGSSGHRPPPRLRACVVDQPTNMVRALNEAAAASLRMYEPEPPFAIGFMGDDHRPRTVGWDVAYLEALWDMGTGIVYGDDLLQGRRLPTQCAMTTDIVRELGYMSPPSLTHMYVDNFWLALGEQAQCIRYLPQVVVEHLHPVNGKADWDEGYKRVNDPSVFHRDAAVFHEYCRDQLAGDAAKVRALRGSHV